MIGGFTFEGRDHQSTEAHFGASFSLCDRPFDRSPHRQHSHANQVLRRAAAEFAEPIVVNADALALILGIWNSEQSQAKAWIDNLGFNMIEVLIDDPGLEIVGTRPGLL